jgi:hypothetical protein
MNNCLRCNFEFAGSLVCHEKFVVVLFIFLHSHFTLRPFRIAVNAAKRTVWPKQENSVLRPRTHDFWVNRIRVIVANDSDVSAAAIRRKFINEERIRKIEPPTALPSDRVIRRIMAEFKAAPAAERQPYTYFSWPATMESGAIPWEASRALLDWLKFRASGGRRQPPLTRQAVWFWRVTHAVPHAPIERRDILSFFYTLVDCPM